MLKTRVLTSALLMPVFLAALFLLPETYWALLMLAVILMGVWEWAALARFPASGRLAYVLLTLAAGLVVVFGDNQQSAYLQQFATFWGILLAALFWLAIAPIWLATRFHFRNLYLMAVAGWLVIVPLWFALVSLRRISPLLLLAILAAIWIADTAAYFFGKRFGRHKLAPKISPGKTWEGVVGAWAAVSIYGLILCQLPTVFFHNYWLIAGLWGLTVLSIMGDLLESLMKRQANLKDSGTLLPGHGGMLDRIDGLTSSLPLAAFFIHFPLYYVAWFYYV